MTTPILDLDEWVSAQAQPDVTVNEALRWLECFAALSVASQAVASPPSGADGDRYIVGAGATGEWAGHEGQIALRIGGGWSFRSAPAGAIAWLEDESLSVRYLSGIWEDVETGGGGGSGGQDFSFHASFDTAAPVPVNFNVPLSGLFYRWTVIGHGGPGDAVIDVRYSGAGATVPITSDPGFSAIGSGTPPAVTAGHGASDFGFGDWDNAAVESGFILQFVLLSSTTFTRVDFQLDVERTYS